MWSVFAGAVRRGCVRGVGTNIAHGLVCPGCPGSAQGHVLHRLAAVRGFYFPRAKWFPWRVRLIHERQAALRRKRHIWPRRHDAREEPIFTSRDEGAYVFRDIEIRLGLKRLLEFARIIRGRQLQDAVDWVESMSRMKSESILKLLRRTIKECTERHHLDLARVFVIDAQPSRGFFVKSIRKHTRGRYGINKSPRNLFMVRVREMPLEEFFHRIYINGRVPKAMASDMRLALHQKRVSPQMTKEWAPYLCAKSRMFHRIDLKWSDSTRQFDYYQARQAWIEQYKANLLRESTEAREARGLPPVPVAD